MNLFSSNLNVFLDKYKKTINGDIIKKILESHNCLSSANFFAVKCENFTYNVNYYISTGKYVKALTFLKEILKILIGNVF